MVIAGIGEIQLSSTKKNIVGTVMKLLTDGPPENWNEMRLEIREQSLRAPERREDDRSGLQEQKRPGRHQADGYSGR